MPELAGWDRPGKLGHVDSEAGKLTCHGIARVSHSSPFHYLFQPAQICRHFLGREFSNQSKCRAP